MTSVLAEHHDYLSLEGRSALYDAAIAQVLRPGDVVADLGCGFGVLGMQCLKAGASQVYGIDSSGAIAIAREAVARAGLADRYACIAGSSYRTELPEMVDLVICDHVGWFGVDYDIIPMLEDARRRSLKPGGRILPRRLRLVAAGVSSDACRALAEQWDHEPIPPEYRFLREYQVNSKHSREFAAAEIATPPQVLGEIDLTQDSPASFAFTAALTAPQGYRFDGIAGWFECELAEGVWMTNSPLAAPRIARHQIFLAARDPFAVRPGEAVEVALRCRKEGDVIGWTIQPPGGAPRQKLSTFNAMALDKRALAPAGFGPLALNATGQARSAVLALADGTRTAAEIEAEVLAAHPALFPSEAQIRQFVRAELGQSTAPC